MQCPGCFLFQITSLPGWDGPLPVKQYSGYLPVGKTSGVPGFIHYWPVTLHLAAATCMAMAI